MKRGAATPEGSAEWKRLRAETVPPYALGRFENKFRKMAADELARTVPAHLGKDCYSHIHPENRQARTISIREAARLRSLPDAFEFCGSMNARDTQIGNAVPPLLAYAVAEHLRGELWAAHRGGGPGGVRHRQVYGRGAYNAGRVTRPASAADRPNER